ncbi:MAG: glutamine-hydrolyzing carbamoyl-phosphate synthase small subunit [Atopobiaceae bacterium]|jgi:carbamoyl-phosphate synthase small subunit|nr:glutamine-hydrolyzing carbamoyl-phosphate synthase small subunit [Atopobiaceae bacterium]
MNLLVGEGRPPALLALEDGTTFAGWSAGAQGEAFGEVVFNTSMTGYQEILSDPSYAGQIVALTYPQVGNYGIARSDFQAARIHLGGLVVRDMCYTPSSWRSTESLPELLCSREVVAIEGVDTRALTLRIRGGGAMRAAISTTDLNPQSLVARVQRSPGISDYNHVPDVSCTIARTEPAANKSKAAHRVVAYDCGMKRGILDGLAAQGCEVRVVPWNTPACEVLALEPDGVFFSNGPGDPGRVWATVEAAREILGKKPVFGICLGNQIITLAADGRIEKLPFGHHGGNEPVINLLTGRVEITAQNHNFGTVFQSLGPLLPEESGGHAAHVRDLRVWSRRGVAPVVRNPLWGRIQLTHVNLNDGTPEGMRFLDIPAFGCQYHPEAKPGPSDAAYFFASFVQLMDAQSSYLVPGLERRLAHA